MSESEEHEDVSKALKKLVSMDCANMPSVYHAEGLTDAFGPKCKFNTYYHKRLSSREQRRRLKRFLKRKQKKK